MKLKNKIATFLCLILVLMNAMSFLVIRIGYELNKDYIAANLCVNKDTPKMGCNGQCHLKKKIKEASGDNDQKKPVSLNVSLGFEYLVQETENVIHKPVLLQNNPYKPHIRLAKDQYEFHLMKPPC